MQETLDKLYWKSKHNLTKGVDLLRIITSEENIMLAYRTLKSNKGSSTAGMDHQTIDDFKILDKKQYISEIRDRLNDFKPDPIRRIEIPKPNGKMRPLGIPSMSDRLIGQMIMQVLTPICEAKFYDHSYGFRENRSVRHALARCHHIMSISKCHYVVDVDIKSFFDHVNHTKLLSQLYTIGVKDRRVLAIIGKMLKAEIIGVGIPERGTPQGHVISPLLSNVVLNDLDWWVASQWIKFPTRYNYAHIGSKYPALKKNSNLKEMHIVRYADDFKIFTRTAKEAQKTFQAVRGYLKNHLKLEISPEKSQITNLRKRSSEFLGIEIKVVKHQKGYKVRSHVSKSNQIKIRKRIKTLLKEIQKEPTRRNVCNYNAYVLGVHQSYSIATQVSTDFHTIAYSLKHTRYNRLRRIARYEVPRSPPPSYRCHYKNNYRTYKIGETYLYPLEDIKLKKIYNFNQRISRYTEVGRSRQNELTPSVSLQILRLLSKTSHYDTVEYSDNRISRYSMQNGKCSVTGYFLEAEDLHCHHVLPLHLGGTDRFDNLVIVHKWVHKLIHGTTKQTINKYQKLLNLDEDQAKKLNKYREKCNLIKFT